MDRSRSAQRKMTAKEFFSFDIKDTMRLIVWLVIVAFTAGTLHNQRKADLLEITATRNADVQNWVDQRKADKEATTTEVTYIKQEISALKGYVSTSQISQTAILSTLESLKTEVRYVNEKIDVLRHEIRAKE